MEVGWWTERVSLRPMLVYSPWMSYQYILLTGLDSDDLDRHIEYEPFRDTSTLA